MALATAEDLRVFLGLEALTAEQATRADLLLDLASAAIEAAAGQPLLQADETETTLGTGTTKLVLGRWPVTAVTEVTEIDLDGVETTLTVLDDYHWSQAGILYRRNDCWPCAPETVRVAYQAGFAVVSDDLKGVTLRTATRGWDNPGGVSMERIGDWQASYVTQGVELSEADRRIVSRYSANR